jgi:hypothetical protein
MNKIHTPLATIIPCPPGWYAVAGIYAGDRITTLYSTPIVAWRILTYERDDDTMYDEVFPIVAESASGDPDDWLIRRQDGLLYAPYAREFTSDAEAIAFLNERDERARQRRAASRRDGAR